MSVELVTVTKQFTLLKDDDSYQTFYPGPQHIASVLAKHWYVRLHLEGVQPEVNQTPQPGSQAHAALLKAQHDQTLRQFQMEAQARGVTIEALQQKKHDDMLLNITKENKVEAKRASRRAVLRAKSGV